MLKLVRYYQNDKRTLGCLSDASRDLVLYTLELADRRNQQGVSCIPAGEYQVVQWESPSKGKCLLVKDVPGRENILIHVGNTEKDTEGCILVGMCAGSFNNNISVQQIVYSKAALQLLLNSYPSGFTLRIFD